MAVPGGSRPIAGQFYDKGGHILNAAHPDFGVKCDGQSTLDAAMTSGSPTLTSASATFTAADAGKLVHVRGAGAAGADLVTTILSFVSVHVVTLAANAGTTVSGMRVRWGTANAAKLQAAIDWAIYLSPIKIGKVFVPDGDCMLEDWVHLGYGTSYTHIVVSGNGRRYNADPSFGGTQFSCTFGDRPPFVCQGGRATGVESCTIVGVNFDFIANSSGGVGQSGCTVDDTLLSAWTGPSLGPNALGRYTVYAAFSVDPFSGAQPATHLPTVTYPGFLGAPAQYNKNFSSEPYLKDVAVYGFVVPVALQACDADGNGDFLTLQDFNFAYNLYGLVVGNSQSRNVNFYGTCNFNITHTVFDTATFGRQNGSLGGVISGISVGASLRLINHRSGFLAPTFHKLYAEALWRIGDLAGASSMEIVTFESCTLHIGFPSFANAPRGLATNHIAGGGVAVFNNCNVQTDYGFIADQATLVTFSGGSQQSARMDPGNTLRLLPDGSTATALQRAKFMNTLQGVITRAYAPLNQVMRDPLMYLFSAASTGAAIGRKMTDFLNVQDVTREFPIPRHVRGLVDRTDFIRANIDVSLGDLRIEFAKSGTNVTLTGIVATFTDPFTASTNTFPIGPGDLLFDTVTNTYFIVTTKVGSAVTAQAINNWKSVAGTPTFIPTWSTNTGSIEILYCGKYANTKYLYGDFTSASGVISNVGDVAASVGSFQPAVNDYLLWHNGSERSPFTNRAVKITAFDTTARTITVDQNANRTVAGLPIMLFYRVS
jgi:hypothetical protein